MKKLGILASTKLLSVRRNVIAATAICALAAAAATTTATDAQAIIPANCTFHFGGDPFTYVAVCYSPTGGDSWHLQLTCQRGPTTYVVNGSHAYNTAPNTWAYSKASCGPYQNAAELISEQVVNGP